MLPLCVVVECCSSNVVSSSTILHFFVPVFLTDEAGMQKSTAIYFPLCFTIYLKL